MLSWIQSTKAETLVYTDGLASDPHGMKHHDAMPTTVTLSLVFWISGPPLSPCKQDAGPVQSKEQQAMGTRRHQNSLGEIHQGICFRGEGVKIIQGGITLGAKIKKLKIN